MYRYRVSFMYQGRNYTEEIGANSGSDAIALIKSQYRGAAIFGAVRV